MSQPTPTPLLKAKMKTAGFAAAAMTLTGAMTLGVTAAPEILASRDHAIEMAKMQAEVDLAAALGIYPVGPGAQIARQLGLGSAESALNTLDSLAELLPGQIGDGIGTVTGLLQKALGLMAGMKLLPDLRVPRPGPAGTVDAVGSLEGDAIGSTAIFGLVSLLKTLQANIPGPKTNDVVTLPGGSVGETTANLVKILKNMPLNAPGESVKLELLPGAEFIPDDLLKLEGFFTTATKMAIIPTWGLGGTNAALASPDLMKMKDTIVLIVALRNTSRPGGGIVALLNPASSLFGLPLANANGKGEDRVIHETELEIPLFDIDLGTITTTEHTGNLTVWDITAAYDLLSDAPSTIWNPLAWANSGVGFAMPSYLIPSNVTDIAEGLDGLLGGDILGGLGELLEAMTGDDGAKIHFQAADDGNWYITYDSGHLPLLEPFQVLPRTISYIPGFKLDTPVSSSFEDVLTQLVATGYQDVKMTTDSDGVATFERGFDMAGEQAKLWQSPVTLTQGLELPQTVFNSVINGLDANLLDPDSQRLELFNNTAIGDAVYRNPVTLAAAQLARQLLGQLKGALNPVMNQVQGLAQPVTEMLDGAIGQVNGLIDGAGVQVGNVAPDLYEPMMKVNRFFNNLPPNNWDDGIPGALGGGGSSLSLPFNANAQAKVADSDAAPRAGLTASVEQALNKTGLNVSDLNIVDKDSAVGKNATKIAAALKNPAAGLKDGADKAEARFNKQFGKVKGNLAAEKARADRLVGAVKSGKPDNVVKTVKENVKERVSQVKKDLNDGAKKVEKTVKKVTDRDAA